MEDKKFNEESFWELIESAWEEFEEYNKARLEIILKGGMPKLLRKVRSALNNYIVPLIGEKIKSLTKPDLITFDRILEKKLYDIDREDVQDYIEGGDDGFLYNRGLVVGLGKDYYYQILNDPIKATNNKFSWYVENIFGSQTMCFIALNTYIELYSEMMPESDISRESYSNEDGWPEDF